MKKDKEIPGNKENQQAFKHMAYLGVVRNGVKLTGIEESSGLQGRGGRPVQRSILLIFVGSVLED